MPRSGLAVTPARARLGAGLAFGLAVAIAGNALLLQRGAPMPIEGPVRLPGTDHAGDPRVGRLDGVVTGVRPGLSAEAAPQPIKTAGLPPQTAGKIDQDIKRWRERLEQLESEARGPVHEPPRQAAKPASLAAEAGAVERQALEPAIAHRLDDESVAPVTQATVRALQRELTERGYDPGPADGNIGLLTQAAIMAYEHDEGLALTGEPSERLLRRMILGASADEAVADPAVARAGRAASRDGETAARLIKGVQRALAGLKYAPGRTDGVLSDETMRAIREFEMDQGLVPSGRISGRLIVRIARASGKAFVVPVQ